MATAAAKGAVAVVLAVAAVEGVVVAVVAEGSVEAVEGAEVVVAVAAESGGTSLRQPTG